MKNLLKLIVAMTLVGAGLLGYSYFQKHYYIGLGGIQKYERVQIYKLDTKEEHVELQERRGTTVKR
ncbi:hypothetical protein N9J07_05655 [Bacteroidia bacterium]|nr:hypothetical protein [Bacteroidia bacterium]